MGMSLKQKLRNNETTIGSWITIGSLEVAEIMSMWPFDWLTIDLEHSSISLDSAKAMIAVIKAAKKYALVRVGKNDDDMIKKALDIGADGIIVPMINDADDALRMVNNAKYPPEGTRGVGLHRAQKYGFGFETYLDWVRNECVIIAQIEHISGVRHLEEIMEVDGIDGYFIGPYDLSGSLGHPGQFDMPEVRDAIEKVKQLCVKHNKPLGIHVIKPDHAELLKKVEEGYHFLAFSLDFYFLADKIKSELSAIKKGM